MHAGSFDPVTLDGACHCGKVKFRAHLHHGLASARRCTCSYCAMRGAVAVSSRIDGLEVVAGRDELGVYQFNTGVAKHYFCRNCGIYTFHQRRSNPNEYGVNVACLDGLSPFDFPDVPVLDGQTHPSDREDGQTLRVGTLKYVSGSH
nr:GFA family protein [uncultured Sphingomonas sp.]